MVCLHCKDNDSVGLGYFARRLSFVVVSVVSGLVLVCCALFARPAHGVCTGFGWL
jgi:hypothetical protein